MLTAPKISVERASFSSRLKQTLESAHGLAASPTVLAREFNFRFEGKPITVHAARKWLVGEAIPTQDKLRALALWLSVSVDWLRFGGNERQVSATADGTEGAASPQDNLIRMFLALPHRERSLALAFIEMLGKRVNQPGTELSVVGEKLTHS